jgi:hypothetical protein
MTNDTVNRILVAAALVAIFDSLFPRLRYVWKFLVWSYKKLKAISIDQPPTTLNIPPPPKPLPGTELLAPAKPTELLSDALTQGGAKPAPLRYIMGGGDKLLAYELPGKRFLVERHYKGESQPRSTETSNRDEANGRWRDWYVEWKQKGFGGCFGTGMDGQPPF